MASRHNDVKSVKRRRKSVEDSQSSVEDWKSAPLKLPDAGRIQPAWRISTIHREWEVGRESKKLKR